MDVSKANDKLAAQLGLSAKESKRVGKVAGTLYKNAYGDSIEGVNQAVGAVMTSIDGMGKASGKRLESVTAKALDFSTAMEVDVGRASQVAGQLVRTGLAKNAESAFDLLTTASHKVPAALREDVLDAADEYGQFFAGIGMNGKQAFSALVEGAKKGQFGLDKIGDAVKEFTIRSTDMSKTSVEAYGAIGLDAETMANKMVKGGKTAGKATQDIIKGLLKMEPGAKQANAAIGLFGTPLEDLSVQEIPAFLKTLQGSGKAMDGFKGSTERMGKTLNDNASTNLESFKRQVQTTFVDFVGGKALPAVEKFASKLAKDFGPAVESVMGFLGRNTWVVKTLAVVFGALGVVLVTYHAAMVAAGVATKVSAVAVALHTGVTKTWTKAKKIAVATQKAFAAASLGTRIQLAALVVQQVAHTVATKAWAVATKAAAVAQRVMNAAMKANPIGLVITAIGLLVGALVWFFTKTKTGRKIVKAVWGGIKSAIKGVADWWTKTAWPAIRGALKSMGEFFKMIGRVVGRAWRAMGDGIGKVWRWIKKNVIDRFVLGLKVWAAIFKIIGRKVRNVWSSIGDALGKGWRWIKRHVIDNFVRGLKVLRDRFVTAKNRVSDIFWGLARAQMRVWKWIDRNVFDKFRAGLSRIKDAFRSAKNGIGKIWDGLKKAASKPVKFMIQTVWNNGLRKMLNAIPGVDIKPIKARFRQGGSVNGPGTGTSDSVVARLSKGEHVWTAKEVAAAGGQKAMYAMRQAVLKGNLNGDPKFANGGHLSSQQIARAQAFANQQRGKPYGWGAVGPSAYDCSGFMSALTNVLRGRSPHSRVGATANFPWSGFERGPGQFTIGSTSNYAGSGVGHMAGNLAGLGVESRGGRGVLLGSAAMSPSSSGFSGMYHLGAKGKLGDASGGWLDHITSVLSAMRKLPGQVSEMLSGGSWIAPFLKKMTAGVWSNLAGFLNKKIPDFGPIPNNPIPRRIPTFDNGGTLSPGYNTVYNGLGKPEALRRADQGGGDIIINLDIGGKRLGQLVIDPIRHEVRTKGGGDVQAYLGRGKRS